MFDNVFICQKLFNNTIVEENGFNYIEDKDGSIRTIPTFEASLNSVFDLVKELSNRYGETLGIEFKGAEVRAWLGEVNFTDIHAPTAIVGCVAKYLANR